MPPAKLLRQHHGQERHGRCHRQNLRLHGARDRRTDGCNASISGRAFRLPCPGGQSRAPTAARKSSRLRRPDWHKRLVRGSCGSQRRYGRHRHRPAMNLLRGAVCSIAWIALIGIDATRYSVAVPSEKRPSATPPLPQSLLTGPPNLDRGEPSAPALHGIQPRHPIQTLLPGVSKILPLFPKGG